MSVTKICTDCGVERPATLEYFYAYSYGGLQSKCKPCYSARALAVYRRNRDLRKEQMKSWHKNPLRGLINRDLSERVPERTEEHRKFHREVNRRSYAADLERSRARNVLNQGARRARERGNACGNIDFDTVLAKHGMVCHICLNGILVRSDLNFDHVIPLAKGGPHSQENLAPAHRRCNQSKGARYGNN